MFLFVVFLLNSFVTQQPTLINHPIVSSGGPPIYLDGTWTATRNAANVSV